MTKRIHVICRLTWQTPEGDSVIIRHLRPAAALSIAKEAVARGNRRVMIKVEPKWTKLKTKS